MEYTIKKLRTNQIVEGEVMKLTDNEATIDLNYFTEGTIYLDHFTKKNVKSLKELVKVGDKITAKITNINEEIGQILLSRLEIEAGEAYVKLHERYKQNEIFKGKVIKSVKGGFIVLSNECEVFIPFKQMDLNRVDAEQYLKKTIEFEIIEFSKGTKKVVGSRIRLLKKQRQQEKQEAINNIKIGDIFEDAEVKKVETWGAFVNLGQVDGLVHFTQITHAHIKSAKDFLNIGDKVKVVVISKEGDRIGLSIKKLVKTPWQLFADEHKVGEKIKGVVTKIMDFGAIIKVDEQVSGMIHKNDISWDPAVTFEDVIQMHKNVEFKIMNIDVKGRKLSLSRKHLESNPWADVKATEGKDVEVIAKEVKQNVGLIVEYQEVEGLVPMRELPEKYNELITIGKPVMAKVLKFNRDKWTLILSVKQFNDEKYRKEFQEYLKTEEKVENQTIGDLFGKKLSKFKK